MDTNVQDSPEIINLLQTKETTNSFNKCFSKQKSCFSHIISLYLKYNKSENNYG